jgi:LacI family transcriptional regulator
LNYIPSAVARSLKNDKTYTLGILVPNNSNPYFAEVIRGVEDTAQQLGYNVILCNSNDNVDKQLMQIQVLMEKRVDGLILVPSGTSNALAQMINDPRLPVVLIDRDVPEANADIVKTDHEQSGYLATSYLLQLGHRKIACVSGPADLPSSEDRVNGYRRALQEYGVKFSRELLIYSDFTSQGGYNAFLELLNRKKPPTAIFGGNDLMTLGGISALAEKGLRVPDDISVVGCDDIELAAFANPALTTITQPKHAIGVMSTRMLINRIKHKDRAYQRKVLLPSLTIRKSTARKTDE